jgi:hypothetical protein
MKSLFLAFAFFCFASAIAQPIRKVVDLQTGSIVPYATVKVLHSPRGVIANEKGEFKLKISEADSVLFSSVGYVTIVVTGKQIRDTVFLLHTMNNLPVVKVENRKPTKVLLLGTAEKLKNTENFGPSGTKTREEFAQPFELPEASSIYYIKKVFIPVTKYRCWGPLLVHVYKADPSSRFPGEEIFIKMVKVDDKNVENGILAVDLSSDKIYISNSPTFFISIGWPETTDKCITSIQLSRSSTEKTYSRQLAGKNYNWFPFGYFKDKFGKPYQAKTMYTVEVDQYK